MGNKKRREPLHPMSPALIADMTGEHEIENPNSLTVDKTVDAILQGDYETILLETDEAEHDVVRAVPETIQRHLKLSNRGRGIRTELILYEEGFLKFSQERRGKRTAEQLLNLRYLDSRPTISRFVAMKSIYVGLGFTGTGALFGSLVYFKPLLTAHSACHGDVRNGRGYRFLAVCLSNPRRKYVLYHDRSCGRAYLARYVWLHSRAA